MKTLNDNTIKQLGNGILDKVRGKYNAYFIGTYNSTLEGVSFGNTLYNRNSKLAINTGDAIIVLHDNISESICYSKTDLPKFDSNNKYTIFTVLDVDSELDGSIYIKALDKYGNTCNVYSANGSDFSINLSNIVVSVTWDHTLWNSSNRIESLVLDNNFLKFKEGDKIRFGYAIDEGFFHLSIMEIKSINISNKTDSTHFNFEIILSKDCKFSEEVQLRCNGVLSGTKYTEKQRIITTNCPTYIYGINNSLTENISECVYIQLPKSNTIIDATLLTLYIPKVGDVVCVFKDSPINVNYGHYLANIIFVELTDTTTPFAILNLGNIDIAKFFIVSGAFVKVSGN